MSTTLSIIRTNGDVSTNFDLHDERISDVEVKSILDSLSPEQLRVFCNNYAPIGSENITEGSSSISSFTQSFESSRTFDALDSDIFSVSVSGESYITNI